MLAPIIIAALLALVFAFAWLAKRNTRLMVWAIVWLAYAVYEYLMFVRVLCSGECNIRVDLLLIYPSLVGGTLWLLAKAGYCAVRAKRAGASRK